MPSLSIEDAHAIEGSGETWSRYFWLALVLLVILFFFVDEHDLLMGTQEMDADSVTQIEEGSTPRRISLFLLGALGMYTFLRRDRGSLRKADLLVGLLLSFLLWTALSLIWTEEPGLTFRRLSALLMLCLGAFALMRYFSVRDMVWFVFFFTGFYLTAGLFAELALGTFRPLIGDYRFAGTCSPNMQGINCGLLMLTAMFLRDTTGRRRTYLLAAALAALIFLVLTKSRTSLVCAILALFFYWSFVLPASRKLMFTLCLGVSLCLFLFFANEIVFSAFEESILLGRDSDSGSVTELTGRVSLWEECLTYAKERPLLGYGYGGFWTPSRTDQVSMAQGWPISAAHSAYLDLLLGVGPLGVVIYGSMLVVGVTRSFIYYRITSNASYAFLGALLFFCVFNGFTESAIVQPTFLQFLSIASLTQLGFEGPVAGDTLTC